MIVYEKQANISLVHETCCNCGIVFAMPDYFKNRKLENKDTFYCPNGHPQHYTGKSLNDQLREKEAQITSLKCEKINLLNEKEKVEKKFKRHVKRAKNGVCPCCNRSFQNVRRHMLTLHPEYGGKK